MSSPSNPIPLSSHRQISPTTPTSSYYPSSPLRPIPITPSTPSSGHAAFPESPVPSLSFAGSYGRRRAPSGSYRSDGGMASLSRSMSGNGGIGGGAGSAGFVGSYNSSLLSFRFSTSTSPPLPFRLSISVLGLGPSAPPSFKCPGPPHLTLPFTAHFFPLSLPTPVPPVVQASTSPPTSLPTIFANRPCDSTDFDSFNPSRSSFSASPSAISMLAPPPTPPSTPYLASISLTNHFLLLLSSQDPTCPSSFPSSSQPSKLSSTSRPHFPGYALPPKGQLQFLVSNPTGTGVKIFLVPFDVRGMPEGSRVVIRQNTYERVVDEGGNEREVLRGSVSFKICSPKRHRHKADHGGRRRSSTVTAVDGGSWASEDGPEDASNPAPDRPHHHQKYYLHSSIRLIFSSLSSSPFSTTTSNSSSNSKGPARPSRFRTVTDLGDVSSGDSRFQPYEAEELEEEYERLRKELKKKAAAEAAAVGVSMEGVSRAGSGRERKRSESRGRKVSLTGSNRTITISRGRKPVEREGHAAAGGSDKLGGGEEPRAGEGIVFAKRRPPSLGRKGGRSLLADLAGKRQSHRSPSSTEEEREKEKEKEGRRQGVDVLGIGLNAALKRLDLDRGSVKDEEEQDSIGSLGR